MASSTSLPQRLAIALHRTLYRAGVGRRMMGAPVLILNTHGRKSGRAIATPLMYFEEGDDLFLIASKGGAPGHPAWYLNLVADPAVTAQIGNQVRRLRAEPVGDRADRDRLYAKAVAIYKGYDAYEKKTDRVIPVVRLSPAA